MLKALLLAAIITFGVILTGCGSKSEYTRNSDYTYGKLSNDNIESVYELIGTKTEYSIDDYTDGITTGSKGHYFVTISETASGGVVAWGENMYVYSPDKSNIDNVRNALVSELMNQNQSK